MKLSYKNRNPGYTKDHFDIVSSTLFSVYIDLALFLTRILHIRSLFKDIDVPFFGFGGVKAATLNSVCNHSDSKSGFPFSG
ncbi:hypothetical protein J1TS3_06030 [Siminovitchia fordii]|uniref:Uncharacterized protein n=1 Tax=Siminovitchia fordii TaxID=254759 RepID=A0ABQ4K164_9BACI|nr:hypothetical protein J1TS3_06030 [Siminovitchia fordii]